MIRAAVLALVGATLIDGTGAPPVREAVVIVRDGRVMCAGPRARCDVPHDAEIVDLSGRWLIPGLVDAHVHYSQTGWADGRPDALDVRDRFPYDRTVADLESRPERFHRAWLCSGVTAVFDVGGYPWTWDLRGATATSSEAPLVGAAGPLLSTIDHWVQLPSQRQFVFMASDSATRAGARELAAFGTDAFKVWFLVAASGSEAAPDTTRLKLLLAAAADEARRAGIPLTLHGPSAHLEMEALARGGCRRWTSWSPPRATVVMRGGVLHARRDLEFP